MRTVAILAAAALLAACETPSRPGTPTGITPRTVSVPSAQERIAAIARDYRAYAKVDDSVRWAPAPCAAPVRDEPKAPWSSASTDTTTHGAKLFYLYASDPRGYSELGPRAPEGLTVVKEAWEATPVDDLESATASDPTRTALRGGKKYAAVHPAGLFVMTKMSPDTPGTDAGWLYGAVAPDGQVIAAGRLEACAGCHDTSAHDRLFGMPN